MSLRPRSSLPLGLHCIVEGKSKALPEVCGTISCLICSSLCSMLPRLHHGSWKRGCVSIEMAEDGQWSLLPRKKIHAGNNFFIFYSNEPLQDLCSIRRLLYNLSVLCVLNMKIRVQRSCVWNEKIFLEQVLQNQGCGTILVKYQLMACESCFLFVLMFFFFHSGALKNSVTACEFTFFHILPWTMCLLLPSHGDSRCCFLIIYHSWVLKACIAKVLVKYQIIMDCS